MGQNEELIAKDWGAEAFQKKHENARNKVEIYMQEMSSRYQDKTGYGFIRHMESRMKTPESIVDKLQRKGYDMSFACAVEKLNDISGARVICYSLREIYWIAKQISRDEQYEVIKFKDYIRNPKKNGYESYHMVLSVPVNVDGIQEKVRVELQLRTIIMDAWAAMDNRISYKNTKGVTPELEKRVEKYAKIGRRLDKLIQRTLDEA